MANLPEVQCLLDEGFLHFICNPEKLVGYWDQLLQDFPEHPASQHRDTSFPISIYGCWIDDQKRNL